MWKWKKIQKMPFTTRIDELKQEFNRFLFQLGLLPERKPTVRHFVFIRSDASEIIPKSVDNGDDFFKMVGIKFWYEQNYDHLEMKQCPFFRVLVVPLVILGWAAQEKWHESAKNIIN